MIFNLRHCKQFSPNLQNAVSYWDNNLLFERVTRIRKRRRCLKTTWSAVFDFHLYGSDEEFLIDVNLTEMIHKRNRLMLKFEILATLRQLLKNKETKHLQIIKIL